MANTYLTKESLSWIWSKIKTALSGKADASSVTTSLAGKKNTQSAVSDPTASGTSLTFISGITQNAQGVISPSKKTVSTMGAATSSTAGTAGLVPAPAAGKQAQFLRGDGTWQTPANTKNTAGSTDSSEKLFLIGATSQAANPQTYSQDTAYVGTDGCLYSGGTKVLTAHQDISGKKSTQAAVSDPTASGTGVEFISGISQNAQGVISPSKKTVRTMGAASSSAAGSTGLVPAPASGKQAQFLRGDATWQTPTDTKNTAGSTDSSSKLFLIGATSQAANPQTYSHDTAYVGTDGCLYSGGTKVLTAHQSIAGKIDKSVGQAAGDIMYFSASSTPARLAIGTAGQVLKVVNGVPSWGDVPVTPMTTTEIETACPYPSSGDIIFNTPTLKVTRSSSAPTNASDGDIWVES